MTTALEEKELSLVGKVELRIALADSDEKLEALLKTYLAPLLLKLASEHASVRNKVGQPISSWICGNPPSSGSVALPTNVYLPARYSLPSIICGRRRPFYGTGEVYTVFVRAALMALLPAF